MYDLYRSWKCWIPYNVYPADCITRRAQIRINMSYFQLHNSWLVSQYLPYCRSPSILLVRHYSDCFLLDIPWFLQVDHLFWIFSVWGIFFLMSMCCWCIYMSSGVCICMYIYAYIEGVNVFHIWFMCTIRTIIYFNYLCPCNRVYISTYTWIFVCIHQHVCKNTLICKSEVFSCWYIENNCCPVRGSVCLKIFSYSVEDT